MLDGRIKLVIYVAAISAAYVDLIGSLAADIWHPVLYWVIVSSIIPLALLGIRRVYTLRPPLTFPETPQNAATPVPPKCRTPALRAR